MANNHVTTGEISVDRAQCTLLFLRRYDEILLAMKKRGHGKGKWNGVGGKVDQNETIEQAARRECREETGVSVVSAQKTAILHFGQEPYVDKYSNIDVHVFVASSWDGAPIETEEMSPKWFKITNLPLDNMWPDDAYWLPEVIAGNKLEADFLFNDRYELIKHSVKIVTKLL